METIEITFDTRGSLNKTGLLFNPSMVNNIIKSRTIYFSSRVLFDKTKILKTVPETSSIFEIFTNQQLFYKLANYNANIPDTSVKLSRDEIKDANFEFMRKLWFVNNSKIKINDNVYTIVSSSIKKRLSNQVKHHMSLSVMISKDESVVAIKRLTCKEKRDHINKLFNSLFGPDKKFFTWRPDTDNRYFDVPSLFKVSNKNSRSNILTESELIRRAEHKVKVDLANAWSKNMFSENMFSLNKDAIVKSGLKEQPQNSTPLIKHSAVGGNKTKKRRSRMYKSKCKCKSKIKRTRARRV